MPNVVGGTVVWNLDIDKTKFSSGLKSARSDIDAASRGIKGGFASATDSVSKFGTSASSSLKNVGREMAGIGSSIISFAKKGALALTGMTVAAGIFAVKSAGDFEQARIAFDVMLGSAERGAKMMKDISDFARKTPFELPEVVTGAKQLLAYSIEAENILPTLSALGNISAGVGRDKLPQLILAYGQVRAATKLTGNELRQFTEAGVPLLEILAKQSGKTAAQIKDDMENGAAPSFSDVQRAIFSMSQEGGKFFNLMGRQSQTFSGIVSNLKDNVGRLARNIIGLSDTGDVIKGGLFDKFSIAAQDVLKWIDANIDEITAFGQNAIAKAIEWGTKFVTTLGLIIDFLKKHKTAVKTAAIILGVFMATAIIAAGVLAVAVNAVAIVVGVAVAQIVLVVMEMIRNFKLARDGAIILWAQLKDSFTTAVDNIKLVFTTLASFFTTTWETIKTAFLNGVTQTIVFFQTLPANIIAAIGYIAGSLVRFVLVDLPNFINQTILWFEQLPGRIMTVAVNVYIGFIFWITKLWNDAKALAIQGVIGIISFIVTLPGRISSIARGLWAAASAGFNSFKNSAIAWAAGMVQSIVAFFAGLPGQIANAIRGGAGEISGALSSIKNTLTAGFSAGISGKAVGGSVGANRPYFVGEKGVELFVPDQPGTIIPNSDLSPNINSQIDTPGNSPASVGNVYNIKISGAFARSGTELADLFEDGINELNKRLGGAGKPKVMMG